MYVKHCTVEEIEPNNEKINLKLTTLPNVVLPTDAENNADNSSDQDPIVVIAQAEERARGEQKKTSKKSFLGSDRHYATLLHREADQLHLRGDYEAALVLYHKAASICPRDSSHSVAARRTTAAISSAANPTSALRKLLPKAQNGTELSATLCPEAAAMRAEKILKSSPDPSSKIPEILEFFDRRKDLWKMSSYSSHKLPARLTRSQIIQRQLSNQAEATLKSLILHFNAGDFKPSLNLGQELISLATGLRNSYRYFVEAYHYLALIHVSAGRHDRGLKNVSLMINTAKASGSSALFTKSLVTLGVVHLSFGHLEALCRAWECLFHELEDLLPQAWLLHEIGRCHFDLGRYSQSLKLAARSQEKAEEANSKKWLFHSKLLRGQSLLKLGRFGEALEALKTASEIAEEEGDSTFRYIKGLVNHVSKVLRDMMKSEGSIKFRGSSFNGELDTSDRKAICIERMETHEIREDLKDIEKEIKENDKENSVSKRTYVLKRDLDQKRNSAPETIRTTDSDSTYTVRKDNFSRSSSLTRRTYRNLVEDTTYKCLDVSEMGDNELRYLLTEPSVIDKQLKNSKALSKLERESELKALRTLSGIGESQVLKARAEEGVSVLSSSVELLSENLDERISMNTGKKSRNGESKSPEKCIEVDTDWRLDFVRSREDKDLVDGTESIQSGRTYDFVATHALYRHSLPSSSQREKTTEKFSKTFEGFKTIPDSF